MRIVSWDEAGAASASFLAVVPPPPIVEAIDRVQTNAGLASGVVPHITVKSQPGLSDPHRWRTPLRSVLAAQPSFTVALGPGAWFGPDYLYLRASGELARLHRVILACTEGLGVEERFEYDGEGFDPHLTIGAAWTGASRAQLEEAAGALEELELAPFTVTEIVEFRRTSHGGRYRPATSFPVSNDV